MLSDLLIRGKSLVGYFAGPVGDGGAGDLLEGLGVAAVEPAAVGVADRLEGLLALGIAAVDVDEAHVGARARRAAVVDDVGRDVDDLAADGVERAGAQVQHGQDRLAPDERGAHLLEAAQEHPALHGDHGRVAAVLRQVEAALDEARAQVALDVGVAPLDPPGHEGAETGTAHVGRVGHDAVVAAGQGLAGGKGALEPLPRAAAEQAAVAGEADGLADRGEVALARGEQRARLVQVRQGVDQVLPLLECAAPRHVALPQRHRGEHGDVGLDAAAEEAAVQLTGAHGQGQARDLVFRAI